MALTNGHVNGSGDIGNVWTLNDPLEKVDPTVHDILKKEKHRQRAGLEMIASEQFTSLAVLDCLSSCAHNKYSEGQPGARYYGGAEHIDELEILAQQRSLEAYGLSESKWGVNVQPYSGSPANLAVYTALIEPHGRIMGLDLPDGGHLTHGFFTEKKKVSATSIFFESMPYKVNPSTGLIDYDTLAQNALLFRPKIIVAGISCYSRNLDYARFRQIADSCGALLMADMAHISGLVAAGVVPSPFEHCDIVTSTTHKTLRGPRSGIIFYRKGVRSIAKDGKEIMYDLGDKINLAVFPGLQGGPHNTAIAGIAVAMGLAKTEEFRHYQRETVKNAQVLGQELQNLGYKIVTGGTDNHIILCDLSPKKLSGSKAERILELVGISVNKNTVPGDKSAFNPSGIRFGTPPLTTRKFTQEDMRVVVQFIHRAFELALEAQAVSGPKLVEWRKVMESPKFVTKMNEIKNDVETMALKFPLPGRPEF